MLTGFTEATSRTAGRMFGWLRPKLNRGSAKLFYFNRPRAALRSSALRFGGGQVFTAIPPRWGARPMATAWNGFPATPVVGVRMIGCLPFRATTTSWRRSRSRRAPWHSPVGPESSSHLRSTVFPGIHGRQRHYERPSSAATFETLFPRRAGPLDESRR